MEYEPGIYAILRADHVDGFHDLPNLPNKYCPMCGVKQLEDYAQVDGAVFTDE